MNGSVLRRVLTLLLVVGLAAGAGLGLAACSLGSVPEVPAGLDGRPDPVLVAGWVVYADRCANCHGARGQGGRGPSLTGESMAEAYPSAADQIEVVAEGKSTMPGFSDTLTPAEIEAVVRFTREVL